MSALSEPNTAQGPEHALPLATRLGRYPTEDELKAAGGGRRPATKGGRKLLDVDTGSDKSTDWRAPGSSETIISTEYSPGVLGVLATASSDLLKGQIPNVDATTPFSVGITVAGSLAHTYVRLGYQADFHQPTTEVCISDFFGDSSCSSGIPKGFPTIRFNVEAYVHLECELVNTITVRAGG